MSLIVPYSCGGGITPEYGTDVTNQFSVNEYSQSAISLRSVKLYKYGDLQCIVFSVTFTAGTHPKDEWDVIECHDSIYDFYSPASYSTDVSNYLNFSFGGSVTNVYRLLVTNNWTLSSDYNTHIYTPPYFPDKVFENT